MSLVAGTRLMRQDAAFNEMSRRAPRAATLVALLATLTLATLTLTPATLAAQFGPGPSALGTAGAYTALARGHDAVSWNPANLALPDRPAFSLGLINPAAVGAVLGPDFAEFEILTDENPTATARRRSCRRSRRRVWSCAATSPCRGSRSARAASGSRCPPRGWARSRLHASCSSCTSIPGTTGS